MDNQIPKNIKKERAAKLAGVQAEIKSKLLQQYVNSARKTKVLFETYKDGFLKGHSDNFIEFVCESDQNFKGLTNTVIPTFSDGETITGYIME